MFFKDTGEKSSDPFADSPLGRLAELDVSADATAGEIVKDAVKDVPTGVPIVHDIFADSPLGRLAYSGIIADPNRWKREWKNKAKLVMLDAQIEARTKEDKARGINPSEDEHLKKLQAKKVKIELEELQDRWWDEMIRTLD